MWKHLVITLKILVKMQKHPVLIWKYFVIWKMFVITWKQLVITWRFLVVMWKHLIITRKHLLITWKFLLITWKYFVIIWKNLVKMWKISCSNKNLFMLLPDIDLFFNVVALILFYMNPRHLVWGLKTHRKKSVMNLSIQHMTEVGTENDSCWIFELNKHL